MSFTLDTAGTYQEVGEQANTEESQGSSVLKDILKEYKASLQIKNNESEKNPDNIFEEFFNDMGWTDIQNGNKPKKSKLKLSPSLTPDAKTVSANKKEIDAILKKSIVLKPEFEKLHTVPRYDVSDKKLRAERKKEREKTKGKQWFGLPATEMTDEVKHDLEVLQMRSVLDPKRFYKKNDLKVLPKYFQVGKVVDSPLDYYNNRLTRKERKKTIVDELLANAEFNKYNKRKYREIIEEKQRTHYKAWRQAKRLKKKNKK